MDSFDIGQLMVTIALAGVPWMFASLNVLPADLSGGIDNKIHVGDLVRKSQKKTSEEKSNGSNPESD